MGSDYENEIADHTFDLKFTHVTKEGKRISLNKLEDSHLQNIIRLLERKAKEGIVIRSGGGFDALEIWYDEETVYGKEALMHLHYEEYVAEQKRRLRRKEKKNGR